MSESTGIERLTESELATVALFIGLWPIIMFVSLASLAFATEGVDDDFWSGVALSALAMLVWGLYLLVGVVG